ncbi:Os09g0129450 [Oryza sativa Japonica Group]|uniref:Os09g0129450 protein n=2 Tax=Oryza TaxID=4527 RepID=C7J793_ORYSJ|nr:Os09g0129450 [Oryza sativa Japonica Group]|eukprot:NP_001175721.1 Os09g0129450 [Oryza sativa Japonica Group]
MEDHRGEGNDGGIRMISSDELCKHLRIRDGGRARQDGVDDEAGEEEEEPKLEHDKHEGHCMAGSAATSNLGSEI